ncbi:MAG: hypothetical protein ABJO29_00865 [Yoonia sp.]|uniref:hypothetical protein n=1 Tax=Yoonia sp. TaxID=2212373 RepID=UPI003267278C
MRIRLDPQVARWAVGASNLLENTRAFRMALADLSALDKSECEARRVQACSHLPDFEDLA